MANELVQNNLGELKVALGNDGIKKRFEDMLGKKSAGFMSNIMSVVQNNTLLQKADINSIILAASQSAALDLPINPNLGYAALIPYQDRRTGKCTCQFQLMRNAWVELLMRTGNVKNIVNEIVYEGQLLKKNRFTGEYIFDEDAKKSDNVIGYMASVTLTNGFNKTIYWTKEECIEHAKKYSQMYKIGKGGWVEHFDAMALKTVLKSLINKYLPKSIEMLNAIQFDQAQISGTIDNPSAVYIDNPNSPVQKDEPIELNEPEVVG